MPLDAGVGAVMVGHIGLPQIDPTVVKPLPKNLKSKPTDTSEAGESKRQALCPLPCHRSSALLRDDCTSRE